MRYFFEIAGYSQMIDIENNRNVKASCDCKWGTYNVTNWSEGEKICWHLGAALINAKKKWQKKETNIKEKVSQTSDAITK